MRPTEGEPARRAELAQLIASWERAIETSRRQLAAEDDPAERERIGHGVRLLERRHKEFSAELSALGNEERKSRTMTTMIRATEEGITITRAALKALLAFAASDDPSGALDVVAVRVAGGEVSARATDGHSALTFTGAVDGAAENHWDIALPFMRACARALTGTDEIRIEPHGATVQHATVLRQIDHGEDYEPAESIAYHYDAARLQCAFPWTALNKDQKRVREGVSAVGFDAELWARLALVQKATGSRCRMFLGADDESAVVVTSGDDAIAVLMPCRTVTGPKGKRGKSGASVEVEQAVLRFMSAIDSIADPDGTGETTVSFTGPDGVEHEVKPRSRKAK